jgi:hypothetical protein
VRTSIPGLCVILLLRTLTLTSKLYKRCSDLVHSYVARNVANTPSSGSMRLPYKVIVEAIIESALINLVGILLYEIATIAPTGLIEVNFLIYLIFFSPLFSMVFSSFSM